MSLILYILTLATLALYAPAEVWDPDARAFLFLIGWLAVWRYGWGLVHLVRFWWYRGVAFKRRRRLVERVRAASDDAAAALVAPEMFLIVTSYRIPVPVTIAAFEAAIAEAKAYPAPTTIVAALVEGADARLVKQLFEVAAPPPGVRLVLVREEGTGKRDALGAALRAVSRRMPPPGSLVLVQDGDAVLPPGCLAATAPFFRTAPQVAALTTDEDALVPAGGPLLRGWHQLRFTQRHVLMGSLGLSGRLITLTGRMSLYRAEVATDPDFIAAIQHDRLDHWRFGPVKLLTGEDKSAAWWLLQRGLETLYVPDVKVLTIEQPVARGLIAGSTPLMLRWFGNMLRASGRCLALGPFRLGWFTWWCLVDQRISMWTPLVGPIAVALLALTVSPAFLYAYLMWVIATRLAQSLLLLTVRPRVNGLYPLLLYFTQLYGALIKTWVLFRLDRQRCTRQGIAWSQPLNPRAAVRRAATSTGLHLMALAALGAAVALATGVLPLPAAVGLPALP